MTKQPFHNEASQAERDRIERIVQQATLENAGAELIVQMAGQKPGGEK